MMRDPLGINCMVCQPCDTDCRDLICLAKLCKNAAFDQALGKHHADSASQVIITCAGKPDRPRAFRLT